MVSIILLISCTGNSYVIPEDEMVDIMVDMHLAEAMVYLDSKTFNDREDKLEAYNSVFEKYDITKERLDSSIRYYMENAPVYLSIYGKVVERLNRMKDEVTIGEYQIKKELLFSDLDEDIRSMDANEEDSVVTELWRMSRKFVLPEQGQKTTIEFGFENDTANKFDFLVLKAKILLQFNDCSENPITELKVRYSDGSQSKTSIPLLKNSTLANIRLRLPVDSNKVVTNIFGALIAHDKCLTQKEGSVSDVRLYKMKLSDKSYLTPADTLSVLGNDTSVLKPIK